MKLLLPGISPELLSSSYQSQVEIKLLTAGSAISALLAGNKYSSDQVTKRPVAGSFFSLFRRPLKPKWQPVLAAFLMLSLVVASLIWPNNSRPLLGATYTFVQTSWSGGATGNTAVHPTNQTGWNQYSTTSGVVSVHGGADLELPSANYTVTDDGTLSTTGSATGGTFGAGANSSTLVNGSGSGANVTLSSVVDGGTSVDGGFDLSLNGSAGGCSGTGMSWAGSTCTIDTSVKSTFNFSSFIIPTLKYLQVTGSSALTIKVNGNATIAESSHISVVGGTATNEEPAAGGNNGGSGGRGAIGGTRNAQPGTSNGAGSAAPYVAYQYGGSGGGAGAGHGGSGGSGGSVDAQYSPAGGSSYLNNTGGSGGGGGGGTDNAGGGSHIGGGGGGGGGAINFYVNGSFVMEGYIDARGGNGANGVAFNYSGGGGGGSGGFVLIYANALLRTNASGSIYANGGNGGDGTPAGYAGGGGGGGRITIYDADGATNVSMFVTGGTKGSTNNTYAANGSSGSSTIFSLPYATSGTFTSAVIDLAAKANFSTLTYNRTTPANTALTIDVRAGNTATPDGTWTAWQTNISNGGSITALNGNRYVQYRANLSTSNTTVTPSLDDITFNYSQYSASGNLTSSAYNASDDANLFTKLAWTSSGTSASELVRFQVRTSTNGSAWSNWCGYDDTGASCTGSNYFTSSHNNVALSSGNPLRSGGNDRWFQYKLVLDSGGAATPRLSDITATYVVNAPPELQNITASQNANGTVTINYQVRDSDTSTGTTTPGFVTPSFQYWNGSSWQSITALAGGDTANKAVNESTFTAYSATWTAITDFPGQYMNGTAKVRVTVNDNEAANNTAIAESSLFTLDTIAPTGSSVVVNATTTPATLTLASTDNSALEMKISLNSDLAGASFVAFNSSSTISLATNPDTVYAQFRDAYGNTSAIVNATTPEMPTAVMIQDTSNVTASPAEYRLFVAWKAVANPAAGFGSYKVYRSTDQSTWNVVGTVNDRLTNYYGDNSVATGTTYYYRVVSTDSLGNHSFNSASVNGIADGTQNGGEGGGGNIPPVISGVSVSNITPSTAMVTWSTDILSDSTVEYGSEALDYSNQVAVSSMVNNVTSVGQHRVVLSGLETQVQYYFRVRSANSSGTEAVDDNSGSGYNFATTKGAIISGTTVPSLTNTTARIIWSTDHGADSYVVYDSASDFSSSQQVGNSEQVENHEVILTDLTPGTRYYFYVTSDDGNSIAEDKNVIDGVYRYYQFITTNDGNGPVISNISAQPTTTGATVFWTTDEIANSQVEYGLTTSYGTSTTLDSTLTVQHSVTIANLTPATLYNYRIRTADANGNLALSGNQTFTTTSAQDLTAPVISNVTTQGVALTSATVTWTTNESATSVVDYGTTLSYGTIAGNLTSYNTSHSVTLTGLNGNTQYYFRVRSQDAAGNLATDNNSGAGYTFTTSADVTPPVISDVTTALVSDTSAVITWTTNEATTAQVVYGLTTAYGLQTTETQTLNTSQSVTLSGLERNTAYFYKVIARDESLNSTTDDNNGEGYTFTTTLQPSSGGSLMCLVDRLAPQVSSVVVEGTGENGIKVTWFTAEPANSLVDYGLSSTYGGLTGNHRDFVNQHEVIIANLLPASTYHLKVSSYDISGNRGESDNMTVAINAGSETPPDITPIEPEPGETVPPVELAPLEQQAVGVAELASPEVLNEILQAFTRNPFLSGLPEEDFVSTVSELAAKVVAAPQIEGEEPRVVVDGVNATISWRTNKKASSLVAYAKQSNYKANSSEPYDQAASNPNEFDVAHTVKLSGLDPATTYFYQVRSKGSIGPEAKSINYSFTTGSVLPVIESASVVDSGTDTATIATTTNIPTNIIIEYTNLTTNQALTQGETSFQRERSLVLKGLAINTSYTATAIVRDELGNETRSGLLRFSTTLDNEPPVISKVLADSTLYPGKDTKVQTIISWETNEPSSSQVFYQEGLSQEAQVVTLPLDTSLTQNHIVVVTKFKPSTVYKFWVESQDISGNKAKSEDFTILTPRESQTIIDVIVDNFESTFGWLKQLSWR